MSNILIQNLWTSKKSQKRTQSYNLQDSIIQHINSNNINLTNTTCLRTNCVYPKVNKLVAIGDIHGDLSVAIKALKLAGVISMNVPDNFRDISKINGLVETLMLFNLEIKLTKTT